ncbi:HD domain-containing protein [Butyrivibrio sp. YAB3001]|uniref:HD domain-containing protein n=1 Tax=Butyrivibrio sp. YAB3001 TaxID=1520812 RepID=UPI0008F68B1A|nr:HD domain-containing protein [Butyrivibrio sp. YAB3001]SFC47649.1 HD domain-containing protein [Butyrivibrio sp. YAB3001]
MMIDRQRVKEQFASYVKNYNPSDPKIALKIAHTYRVADNCEQIAKSISLSDDEVEFAWLSGMLHDIGRFEQVKRFNTFIDSESVDHAEFGADLLFGDDKLIKAYADDRSWDKELEIVIRQHNKYRIDESIAGKTLIFCNILRDADKVDILRVNVETPMEEIYNVTKEVLFSSGVSEKVMEQVREHHAVNRDVMDSPAEHLIGHIALTFELVYPKSWELAKKQGYLYKMFEFPTQNESMKKALKETREEVESYYTCKNLSIE